MSIRSDLSSSGLTAHRFKKTTKNATSTLSSDSSIYHEMENRYKDDGFPSPFGMLTFAVWVFGGTHVSETLLVSRIPPISESNSNREQLLSGGRCIDRSLMAQRSFINTSKFTQSLLSPSLHSLALPSIPSLTVPKLMDCTFLTAPSTSLFHLSFHRSVHGAFSSLYGLMPSLKPPL